MATLNDVQNSLFVPNLGGLLDRTMNLRLRRPPSRLEHPTRPADSTPVEPKPDLRLQPQQPGQLPPGAGPVYEKDEEGRPIRESEEGGTPESESSSKEPSVPDRYEGEYLVMPSNLVDGYDEWTEECVGDIWSCEYSDGSTGRRPSWMIMSGICCTRERRNSSGLCAVSVMCVWLSP